MVLLRSKSQKVVFGGRYGVFFYSFTSTDPMIEGIWA